jgi:integrase
MASIRERRRKDGGTTYAVLWRDPSDGTQHSMPFESAKDAQAMRALLDANGQSLTIVENALAEASAEEDKGPTLADVFEEHLAQLTDVGPYQMGRYRSSIEEHFADLSLRPVGELTRSDIASWVNAMKLKPGRKPGSTMAAKTIANHHGLLSAALATAVLNHPEHIKSNPCKGIKLPKSTHTEEDMQFIAHDAWGRLLLAFDPLYLPFFQLLIGSGLRLSEAAALEPTDFALDATTPTVRVTKAWKQHTDNTWYIGPPKTPKSRRVVSLAPSTVKAVRPRVEAAAKGKLVFTTERGLPIHPSDSYHRAWKPAMDAVGIWPEGERPRQHDMRHTHASWMIAAGMDIYALSRRLGHESIKTTMDRYSHLLPDAVFRDAAIAEKALAGLPAA